MSKRQMKFGQLEFSSSDGPMRLAQVTRIYYKKSVHNSFYKIYLHGGAILCATNLHAFLGSRDGDELLCSAGQIKPGDQIWIDVSAFSADKSLICLPFR